MSNELLDKFFDETVKNKDQEQMFETYSQYFEKKMKSLYEELLTESEKEIRLKGNDVLVKGKKVGTIKHDRDGEEDGAIEYTCATSGKVSKHDKLANLYAALAKEHKLEESKKESDDYESPANLYILYTKKKDEGDDSWGEQFSGTRKECVDEWRDTKHEWKGYDHKIEKAPKDAKGVKRVEEAVTDCGDKALAKKSEKDFKSFKNDDDLKLKKEKAHEDHADHDESGKDKSAAEKRKSEAKKQAEKAEKSYRKIDWKD